MSSRKPLRSSTVTDAVPCSSWRLIVGAMRNPAFSSAERSFAPLLTTIQVWLSTSGGASAANANPVAATIHKAKRDARIINPLRDREDLAQAHKIAHSALPSPKAQT